MNLFLASNIGGVKKENGNLTPIEFMNNNGFLDNLINVIKSRRKFVLIASDPLNYKKNDFYLEMDIRALKLSGIEFREYQLIDARNKNNIKEILTDCDLIFLSGGDTFTQNKFFNDINLKRYLVDTDSAIVGISAGAINASDDVYNNSKLEDDLNNSCYLKGLGLTKINILPHFILSDYNKKVNHNMIIKDSFKKELIALTENAYIIQNFKNIVLYGEAYRIKNGLIHKICDDNECVHL